MKTRAKAIMKTGPLIWAVMLVLTAGGAGYWLRAQRTGEVSVTQAWSIPPLDYLIGPDSFSRIKNARNSLQGLCLRLRLQVQNRLLAEHLFLGRRAVSRQTSEPRLEGAIRDLERGMQEFEGTEQDLYCAQDLLLALKTAGRFDRWIEVYLKALYEHPTHPLVACFAKDAIAFGIAAGRAEDVLAGLRHLSAIPLGFEGKARVQAILTEVKRRPELTGLYTKALTPSK
jgi:hypothetical protein